jgi:hypothetical protein
MTNFSVPAGRYPAEGSYESPGPNVETNWLLTPKGPYNLTMRVYAPRSEALTGKWNPPPVVKDQGLPTLQAQ